MDICFPAIPSRIGGATFDDLHEDALLCHQRAWKPQVNIQRSGQLKFVHGGEYHCYNPDVVSLLQQAVNTGDTNDYQQFADTVNNRPISTLRDLMQLKLELFELYLLLLSASMFQTS